MKTKLKKGDGVAVIAGKDKGKTGTIVRVFPKEGKVLIDGVNVAKRHRKPNRTGRAGQIVDKAMPIHISNVQIVDPKSGKPSRIRVSREKGVRTRVAAKSGSAI